MHTRSKLLLAALVATASLASAITGASANLLSMTSETFRATYSEMSFTTEEGSSSTRCPVTMEGSFHSKTITKTSALLIGYITRASAGTCTSGSIIWLEETLPWHVRYESFRGALPAITEINLTVLNVSGRWRSGLASCLYRTETGAPLLIRATRNTETSQITGLIPVGRPFSIPPTSLFCSARIYLGGLGVVTVFNSGEAVYTLLI